MFYLSLPRHSVSRDVDRRPEQSHPADAARSAYDMPTLPKTGAQHCSVLTHACCCLISWNPLVPLDLSSLLVLPVPTSCDSMSIDPL